MKKCAVIIVMLISTLSFGQIDFGLKAGVNYSQNGDLTLSQVGGAAEDIIQGSDGRIGFHIGGFAHIELSKFYIRPELFYTKTQSSYDNASYDINKIDLPVLVGYKIVGPVHAFIGPAFQYTIDNELENVTISEVKNSVSLGVHLGVGVQLGNIGIDARYERGLSSNEATFIDTNVTNVSGIVDSRPSQLIFSLSLKL